MTDDQKPSGQPRFRIPVAQKIAIVILVAVFCALMGLIISGKQPLEPGILAMAGILIFFIILLAIYFPVRKLKQNLDEIHDKLEIMTTTDTLTQVFKRNHFNILFEKELSRAKRYERELGCLMLDIDHFRKINDKYGYQFGDEVLRDVAELIKDNLRVMDILARYGSNKFICLLPETNIDSVMILSKRLRLLLEGKIYEDKGETVHITASIGITSCKPDAENDIDMNKIISMADEALAMAKKGGRNRIELFSQAVS